jgi:hypothetical protein
VEDIGVVDNASEVFSVVVFDERILLVSVASGFVEVEAEELVDVTV